MAENAAIARPYAHAVFELANEAGQLLRGRLPCMQQVPLSVMCRLPGLSARRAQTATSLFS